MKTFRSLFLIASTCTLILFSCKKEDTPGTHVPAPPGPAGHAAVSAIPLTGGNINGTWTSWIYYEVEFRNDSLQSETTDTIAAGEEVLKFFPNGTLEAWVNGILFDTGSYVVNGTSLMYSISGSWSDPITFGANSTRMRWHLEETYSGVGGIYRDETDLIFDRY